MKENDVPNKSDTTVFAGLAWLGCLFLVIILFIANFFGIEI